MFASHHHFSTANVLLTCCFLPPAAPRDSLPLGSQPLLSEALPGFLAPLCWPSAEFAAPNEFLISLGFRAVPPASTCARGGRVGFREENLCRGAGCCSQSFLASERQSEILVDFPHQSAEGLFSCHIPTRHSAAVAGRALCGLGKPDGAGQ